MYCASAKEEWQQLGKSLEGFVRSLARGLDEQLDKRLVRTFILTLKAILMLRHTKYGLLFSELGAYIFPRIKPQQAPKD